MLDLVLMCVESLLHFQKQLNVINATAIGFVSCLIVLNFCSIRVISTWSSECIFVTPVHCLYRTVKIVAQGGA